MTPPRMQRWRRAHVRLELWVTPEERADLGRAAQENRGTVTRVIREAVKEYVSDYREGRAVFPPKK